MPVLSQIEDFCLAIFGNEATDGLVSVCRADEKIIQTRDPEEIAEFIGDGESWVSLQTRDESGAPWEQSAVGFAVDSLDALPLAPSVVLSNATGDLYAVWLVGTVDLRTRPVGLTEAVPLPGSGGWTIQSQSDVAYEIEQIEVAFTDPEISEHNDAIIYGTLDPDMLKREIILGGSKEGAATGRGRWSNWKTTVGGLIDRLSKHEPGEKDGSCFLQGSTIGGDRHANSIPHLDILVLDLDTGEDIDALRQRIQALGLFAIIYTTHSNMKPVSDVKKDAVVTWMGGGNAPPTAGDVAGYLIDVKRYRPEILDGAKLQQTEHTKDGIKVFLEHQPMPKFRVVLLLKDRFVIADRANTQQAAIVEWKERYAGASKLLGTWFDRTCVDPSRLFYHPRHARGASDWRIDVVAGKPLDLDTVDRVTKDEVRRAGLSPFEQAAEEMQTGVYKTTNMKRFFGKYGDRFDVETFLLERDGDGDRGSRSSGMGRSHRCPNDDNHTNAGDENDVGFFCVNASDSETGQAVASCRHDSCAGFDRLNLIDLACQTAGIDDAMKLKEWVPDVEGDEEEEESASGDDDDTPKLENKPYASLSEAKKIIGAMEIDDPLAGHVAVNVGMSGFSAAEQDSLKKLLVRKTGVGAKALADEMKIGRSKKAGAEDVSFDDDVATELARLNNKYAAVMMGGKFRIMKEPEKQGTAPEMLDKDSFTAWLQDREVVIMGADGNTKKSPIALEWCRWKERRKYDRVVFQPGIENVGNAYNIWKGISYKGRVGDWSLLRKHVLDNICLGNKENFEWLMTWLAQIFQHPGKKLGSAVVIKGRKGTGKSVLFDWIREAIGAASLKVSRRDEIVGGFNKHQQGLILLVCEEAFWAGDSQAGGVLKDMITSDEMLLTPKGVDSMRFDNFMRLAMISNERWIVPAGLEDERRFFVLHCGDDRRGDIEFFAEVEKQMLSGGIEAMVYELMHWKPIGGDWNVLRKPPVTPWLSEQAQETMSTGDRFFYQIIDNGFFIHPKEKGEESGPVALNEDKPSYLVKNDLLKAYTKFIGQSSSGRHKIGDATLFSRLAEDWLLADPTEYRTDKYEHEGFGVDERRRCILVPALSKIRKHAEKAKKLPFIDVIDGEKPEEEVEESVAS